MSIIWDEKRLMDLSTEEIIREVMSVYSEYQKETAATSFASTGSIFIGMTTENDTELIKNLLQLPAEFRIRILDFIRANFKAGETWNTCEVDVDKNKHVIQEQSLKNLLLTSPHKDLEILIDRPTDTGRDIHL